MVDTGKVQTEPVKITWTKKKLEELKDAYALALNRKQDQFKFEGHDLVTGYAKYLIEHLEAQFKTGAKNDHRV